MEPAEEEASKEITKSEFITKSMNSIYDTELNKIDKEINDIDFNTLKKESGKKLKKYYKYFDTPDSINSHLKTIVNNIMNVDTTTEMKIIILVIL